MLGPLMRGLAGAGGVRISATESVAMARLSTTDKIAHVRQKAAEDCTHSKTLRDKVAWTYLRQVLECVSRNVGTAFPSTVAAQSLFDRTVSLMLESSYLTHRVGCVIAIFRRTSGSCGSGESFFHSSKYFSCPSASPANSKHGSRAGQPSH